jgi:hypothetical protein
MRGAVLRLSTFSICARHSASSVPGAPGQGAARPGGPAGELSLAREKIFRAWMFGREAALALFTLVGNSRWFDVGRALSRKSRQQLRAARWRLNAAADAVASKRVEGAGISSKINFGT